MTPIGCERVNYHTTPVVQSVKGEHLYYMSIG